MFRRRRTPRGDWHVIDSGRVRCPLRGDLDIDNCFDCNHLVDLADDDNASYIVCRPPRTDLTYGLPIGTGF